MTVSGAHLDVLRDHLTLRDRLRQAGILLVGCDAAGELRGRPGRGGDWLSDLCCHSPLFRRAVREAAPGWGGSGCPEWVEALPGVWLVPMPVESRRARAGYAVAVVLTEALAGSEQLQAMCQGAMLDHQLVQSLLADLPPASAGDVPRLARLVRDMQADWQTLTTGRSAVESVGRELAESYEEINLLYTIIRSMTVVQRPDRFVTIACEELLETLPYRWIAAQFSAEPKTLKSLAGRLVVAGEPEAPEGFAAMARAMLERSRPDTPMVIEPAVRGRDAEFAELGRAILVHPVTRDRQILGVLIAADKQGDDPDASSVDMKMLGATATHMAIFLENASLYDDLKAMFLGTLEALTASIDAKDRYTCGHSQRVAHLTQALARAAGLDEQTVGRMRIAGLVHDVGKIGVPEHVLTKPGKLTEDEFMWIRRHPEIGYKILKDIPQLSDILPGVLHHHERWDGRGYPQGLAGEDIPLVARMIALADSFDAMSSTRTYREPMSRAEVIAEIRRESGHQFDPALAPLFVELDFSEFDRLVLEHRAVEAGPGDACRVGAEHAA